MSENAVDDSDRTEDDLRTDGAGETHLDPDRGLWIPLELRDLAPQTVFRTPRATVQHFATAQSDADAYYGLIDGSHFGDPGDIRDPQNPDLAPDRVRIQPQGEDPVELVVNLDPDLRTDGGTDTGDTEQDALNEKPLADWCSLCGQGYHPNLAITIADETDDGEYHWSHKQCKHDHDRVFLDMFSDENNRSLDTETDGGQPNE